MLRSQTCAENIAKAAGRVSRGRGRPPGHGRGRGRGGRGNAASGGAGGGRAAPAAAAATAPAPAREVGAWEDGRQITANVLFEEGELQITRTFITFTECMGLNKKRAFRVFWRRTKKKERPEAAQANAPPAEVGGPMRPFGSFCLSWEKYTVLVILASHFRTRVGRPKQSAN